MPLADERIGVFEGHQQGDPGLDDGVGAGWGPALMGAGLERDVERRPRRRFTGSLERDDLGVGPARRLGRPSNVAPSGVTTTEPTHGLGEVRVRTALAKATARAMCSSTAPPR